MGLIMILNQHKLRSFLKIFFIICAVNFTSGYVSYGQEIEKVTNSEVIEQNLKRMEHLNRCKGCNFENVDLMGFFHNAYDVDLSETNFKGANLSKSKFIDANFEAANLKNTNFTEASLTRALFFLADLSDTNFTSAYLRNANFSKYTFYNTEEREYQVEWKPANLEGAIFKGADLDGAQLQYTNLMQANFVGAFLGGSANLFGANLKGANLDNANLENTHLRSANLEGATLRNAKIQGANFKEVNLKDADLSEVKMHSSKGIFGDNFDGAIFCNTKTPWGIDNSGC